MAKVGELTPGSSQDAKIINEDPTQIQKDLEYLKAWIAKQPHLNARMDDRWLISFLRASKYSLEQTKERIDKFYTSKTLLPEFFEDRDISKGELKDIIHKMTIIPIEDNSDPTKPFYVYYRHHYDPNLIGPETIIKYIFMTIDVFINEYDSLSMNGAIAIVDLDQLTLSQLLHATPSLIKKFILCLEKSYPVRIKSVHYINCPELWERMLNLIKMFCSKKLAARLHVHTGVDTVFKYIPQRLLPSDLGGEGPSRDESEEIMQKKLEEYKSWMEEHKSYGTNEKLRPGKPQTAETYFGIEGSFRKLAVD